MLAVNNSKNPAHDAKSSAKHNQFGGEAGSCWNHSKNPGEVEGGGAMMCSFFDELPSGCRVAHRWAIFVLVPPRGGVAPARGSIPSGGAAAVAAEDPTPIFPSLVKLVVPVVVPGA